ncbi:MAG: protein kinase [Planctomycetota bacterium]
MTGDGERYARMHSILNEARTLPIQELDGFLERACGPDEALRSQVSRLLQAATDEAEDAFADESLRRVRNGLEGLLDQQADTWLPERIGDFVIIRQIGQGGMGVVYEAEQQSPRRRVAIKLLHPMHATSDRLRRFRQEAELLGRLQHPGIAQIFEAGTYDIGRGPQPFIAMELVDGVDIRTHCQRNGLDTAARIELLAQVADAVQHAHERSIIHRDLKPENVLVNRLGQPRVLDFGIARAQSGAAALSTIVTQEGQLFGTLAYMAPEQLRQSPDAITPRVDVYALGVLGFELLVGRPPHMVDDLPVSEAIALLASTEPPRASQFDSSLRGDVETILGKALEPERARRYESAHALAGDLRRHLDDRPIEARRPSRLYYARKFVRRNKALVAGIAATLLASMIGTIVALSYARVANKRAQALERSSYVANITTAGSAIDQQDYRMATDYLAKAPEHLRGWEFEYLQAKLIQHEAEWPAPETIVTTPVFERSGDRAFAMMSDGSIGAWDVSTGELRERWTPESLFPVLVESGGSALLDATSLRYAALNAEGGIAVGSLKAGLPRVDLPSRMSRARPYSWDSTGTRLLCALDGVACIWDGESSRVLVTGAFGYGAFNQAGDRVALTLGKRVLLFDAATGEPMRQHDLDDIVTGLSFSPNDRTLAVAGHYRTIYLFDGHTLELEARLTGHRAAIYSLRWDEDGSRLVSTSKDGTVRVWNTRHREPPRVFEIGETGETRATFLPDGRHILVANDRLRLYPLDDPGELAGHPTYVYQVALSPDGSLLASACYGRDEVQVWDVRRGESLWKLEPPSDDGSRRANLHTPYIAFSDDGRHLAWYCQSRVTHWDVTGGREAPAPSPFEAPAELSRLLGRRPWGASSGSAVSPDGRWLATCSGNDVSLYDIEGLSPIVQAEFRQDDTWPLEGTKVPLIGHEGIVYCVTFSPDGSRIATGGNDATVRIWDPETQEQLLVLRGHQQYVFDIAFSADGTYLASASGDTTVRIWDTKPLHERRALGR